MHWHRGLTRSVPSSGSPWESIRSGGMSWWRLRNENFPLVSLRLLLDCARERAVAGGEATRHNDHHANKYENYPSLCTRTSTSSTSNTSMTVGRGQKKTSRCATWNRIAGPIGAMPRLPTKRSVSRRHKLTRWLCNTPIPSPGFFISILDRIIPND